MKNIMVQGRRWFERVNGNTYCSCQVYIDGEPIATLPIEYGYGSYYMQRAAEWLNSNGYTPGNEGKAFLLSWCRENNVKLIDEVMDVTRKKDLHRENEE